MTTLNLLTDNGFKSIFDINNNYIYNNNLKLTKISYINRFENFYFPSFKISLATGMDFTCRYNQRFKGIIFNEKEIKNELDFELVSNFKSEDYIYTPFINNSKNSNPKSSIDVYNSLNKEFYLLEDKFIDKVKTKDSFVLSGSIPVELNIYFYKFLAVSLIRGKVSKDSNYISYKFNKDKSLHNIMKSDLINFFEVNNLNYEISEYNKYYYINYSDTTLISYVEKFVKEQYNSISDLFNNEYESLFLLYLFNITGNTYYLSYKGYLFFKTLAYNNNLVLNVSKNPIKSNHKYSLKSNIVLKEMESSKEVPEIIYLEYGYLTKIINIESVNLKGDAELLPEYLLVC